MLAPLPSEKWNSAAAAHLLNRAGFGGTPDEISALQAQGLEAAVNSLLTSPNELPQPESIHSWTHPTNLKAQLLQMRAARKEPDGAGKPAIRQARMERREEAMELRDWWLAEMHSTPHPLVEKMTLFWHGHFATSMVKVRNAFWMWRQNETFRRYALGNFRELLHAVSRDPAMMIYLDLEKSRQPHPNENWAREVMELFTLGLGHYSEDDIRASARAFTGYRLDLTTQQFRYLPRQNDAGPKNFLGNTGDFGGDDILDLIVQQPACADFIGKKICRYFVEDEPSKPLIEAVASSLRRHDFELRPVLGELFRSEDFYAQRIQRNQIKSPVQFLVGSCRLLEIDLPTGMIAQNALQQMGQLLLAPPNVKGWDGGKSWISTSTLLFRYNFANYLINGTANQPNAPANLARAPIDAGRLVPAEIRGDPQRVITHLAARVFQAPLAPKQNETLLAYLKSRSTDDDETLRHLLHLMMSTPQYQLA